MVVPTYNERDRLAELISQAFSVAERAGFVLELVIVDDNSPDGTGALADELARTHRIKVLHRAGKLGLGTAVIEGFGLASAAIVGAMDADLSHPPQFLPKMLAAFRATGADMLVASRYIPGGSTSDWPMSRKLMSRLGSMLAWGLTPIRDATSGFFLIRREVAQAVTIRVRGFKIALELLTRAAPSVLVEFPYRFDDRQEGESKMTMREGTGYLKQLRDLYVASMRRGRRNKPKYRLLTVEEVARF
jgi:dolichol-phosphate mannosyltransferase